MSKNWIGLILIFACCGCGNERTDPVKMYAKVQATYSTLSSFQCEGETISTIVKDGKEQSRFPSFENPCQIRWGQPQHLRIVWVEPEATTNAIYESNGKVFIRAFGQTNGDTLGSALFMPTPFSAEIDGFLLRVLLSKINRQPFFVPRTIGPNVTINGTPCYSLLGEYGQGAHPHVTLAIAKETFLIMQVSEMHTGEEVKALTDQMADTLHQPRRNFPGMSGVRFEKVVTYSNVIVNPPFDDAAFTFQTTQ